MIPERATQDADLVADLNPGHVASLVATMADELYIDDEDVRTAVQHRASFNIIHLETVQKVDVFVSGSRAIDREEMRRRQRTAVTENPGVWLYLATAEDVIVQKLDWYRRGGGISDRQWRDVLGIFKVQANRLDFVYLRRWATTLGLMDLLARAAREAGVAEDIS